MTPDQLILIESKEFALAQARRELDEELEQIFPKGSVVRVVNLTKSQIVIGVHYGHIEMPSYSAPWRDVTVIEKGEGWGE